MTNEEIEIELKHMATKEDVANLRAATTKEIGDLRAEMHKEFSNQLKWIFGLQLPTWMGIIGILIAILLHR